MLGSLPEPPQYVEVHKQRRDFINGLLNYHAPRRSAAEVNFLHNVKSPRWPRPLGCGSFVKQPQTARRTRWGTVRSNRRNCFWGNQLAVFAAGALTNTAERPAGLDFPRRDLLIWVCAIIFMNQLFGVANVALSASRQQLLTDLGAVGVFQLMAWYAVFRLVASSDPAPVAQLRDFLIAVALCSLVFVPSTRAIWVAALGVAILCWRFSGGDRKLRAAGIVFAALSVQELWGRIFFDLFALPLLRAETAVVGTMLRVVRAGTEWRDNVISGPSGHGIVVYDYCSSFHNLSLAALCWLTVRSLRDQSWQARDLVIGCVVGITMILFNVTRLCLMAWDANLYHYWHDGAGVQIFNIGASVTILLMSLYGSRSAGRPA